ASPAIRQRSAEAVRERRALVPIAVGIALEALATGIARAADEVAGLRDLVAPGRGPARRPAVASVELHAREDVAVGVARVRTVEASGHAARRQRRRARARIAGVRIDEALAVA